MRPVINLKPLNVFVQKIHFKMENINTALHNIAPGDYLVSLDLKDAYFSIPMFKPHRKFLRIKWSDQTYEFTCLPSGYSLAPRVFTKVLKPVISYLRANGYRIVIFLDDILLIVSSVEECLSQLSSVTDLLQSLGFVINANKSQLIPGWGAVCNGQSSNGAWSLLESQHHINYFELLAAFHALQVFVADKFNIHVRLKMDNSTAVSYINNMEGIRSPFLNERAVSIYMGMVHFQEHFSFRSAYSCQIKLCGSLFVQAICF